MMTDLHPRPITWTRLPVFIALILATACAKGRPHLTPEQRAFDDVPLSESGAIEKEAGMDITIPAFDPLHAAGSPEQLEAKFRGVDRKTPKTSIASGSIKKFIDVAALAAFVTDDAAMLHHTPEIARDSMFRAIEEQQNVLIKAWIYAIKYEADQDWHVIIGTDPGVATKTFFNAEVSGLPATTSTAFETLHNVRQQLADILGDSLPSGDAYRKMKRPIGVVIEGTLFFDVDHEAGVVGPAGMRPQTAWEIHPVTNIKVQ